MAQLRNLRTDIDLIADVMGRQVTVEAGGVLDVPDEHLARVSAANPQLTSLGETEVRLTARAIPLDVERVAVPREYVVGVDPTEPENRPGTLVFSAPGTPEAPVGVASAPLEESTRAAKGARAGSDDAARDVARRVEEQRQAELQRAAQRGQQRSGDKK